MKLAPSLLAADLADLVGAVRTCERGGADLLHVDVMDGHFVPNLTFGLPVIRALRRVTELPLDVHLMVSNPERLLEAYVEAAGEECWVTVHWEASVHLDRMIEVIGRLGGRPGVALNPGTPSEVLLDILPRLHHVLVMSVNPGFGGQAFLPYTLDKARRLRRMAESVGSEPRLEIDGGVSRANLSDVLAAGVHVCVMGSALFGAPDPEVEMRRIRDEAGR